MNKASILFENTKNNGEVYFATRKIANMVFSAQRGFVNTKFFVGTNVDRKTGKETLWLAVPSIF